MRTRTALVLLPLALGFSLRAVVADDSSHNAPPPQTTNLIEQLNDPNPRRRHEAATALVSVKPLPPEAIAAMVRLPIVNDPSAQKALVEAGERAITVVTAAIDGPDPQLRLAALHLLGAMAKRRPKFWPLVIRVFRDEHADVAFSATNEFSRLRVEDRPTPDAALVVPLLRQALRDSDPKVRMGAARAFAQIAPAKEAVPEFIDTLKDPDPNIRDRAANDLARIGADAKEALPALSAALHDPAPYVRYRAAYAIAHIDQTDKEAVPVIAAALGGDDSGFGRETWVETLGLMGSNAQEALPNLRLALRDSDVRVRVAAAKIIGRVGGLNAEIPLTQALYDENGDVRRAAVQSIREFGDKGIGAIPVLLHTLGDSDAVLRNSAAEALSQLGRSATPALIWALRSPDLYTREGAVQALAENKPLAADVISALTVTAQHDKSAIVRTDAATALKEAGVKAGEEALAQMQQEDETAGRQKDVQDQSRRRYSREEIAATIPDEDHEYPLRLEYFITFNATPAPSAAAGFLATVHRGRDRPDRLAVWKQTVENSYQQLLVRESGTSALEEFDVPKVFFPKGQVPGLGVQFLDLREHVSNGWRVEDSLYAVDGDDLRPVQIESPEEWYKSKLQPGESIMNGFANSFSDHAQPAFAFTIWKKGDAHCCPTGGQVTGTYRIVREEWFSNDPKKPWVHNWRLEVESAKREPIRHQVGS